MCEKIIRLPAVLCAVCQFLLLGNARRVSTSERTNCFSTSCVVTFKPRASFTELLSSLLGSLQLCAIQCDPRADFRYSLLFSFAALNRLIQTFGRFGDETVAFHQAKIEQKFLKRSASDTSSTKSAEEKSVKEKNNCLTIMTRM